MIWDGTGRLWVVDPGADRYSVFDTSGVYRANYMRRVSGWGLPWRGGFDAKGDLYEMNFVQDAAAKRTRPVLVRYTVGTDVVAGDTFPVPEREETPFVLKSRGSEMFIGIPYTPSLEWIFDGDQGIIAGANEEYRIARLNLTGDTVSVIQREWTPVPVTDDELNDAVEQQKAFDDEARMRYRERIPRQKPAYSRFIVDDQQRVWVFRYPNPGDDGRRPVDIFDKSGNYVGTMSLEINLFPPPRVIGSHIVGATRDELDVPMVVVYRIQ